MRIFISYRRSDTEEVAGRLYDHLERRLGNQAIFKDVDSIPFGSDFRDIIGDAVARSDYLLALIGPKWVSATDEFGARRLDNPADWVRTEIELALQKQVRVVPLLVGSASMPRSSEMPAALEAVAFMNAARLRPDPDFREDVYKLCRALHLPEPSSVIAPTRFRSLHVSGSIRDHTVELRFAFLFGTPRAIVPVTSVVLPLDSLGKVWPNRLWHISEPRSDIEDAAERLTQLVLPVAMRDLLAQEQDHYLIVFHDHIAGAVPWELLRIDGSFVALRAGLSRRLLSRSDLFHQREPTLPTEVQKILIVSPSLELWGAATEAKALAGAITLRYPSAPVVHLEGQEASRATVDALLNRGQVAVLHYAGHGYYDASNPNRSGIILSDDERFESRDVNIQGGPPPKLVFVSAADSARIGTFAQDSTYGFAEALLAAGVENYVGAQWPQTDTAAVEFAAEFYDVLFRGATVGTAMREARLRLWRANELDALCYVHFGLPEHVLILDQ